MPAPPPAPPTIEESLAALVQAQQQMGAMFDGMQRQMGELSLRVAAIESRPGSSGPPLLPYFDPLRLQYGMPGYGGIPALPASGPVISEILPTPPLPVPTTSLPVSPAVGSQPP